MVGGGGMLCMMEWWQWGDALTKCEAGEGFGAKNLKPSHWGSILGVPLKMVMGGTGRRWWGAAYNAVVVVGQHTHKTEPLRLDFGCTIRNGNRRW
jgi:hypothetical protein